MWYGKSDSNYVKIMGICTKNFTYSHSSRNEGFYRTDLVVRGQNKTPERIPVIAPGYLIDKEIDYSGMCIEVQGQLRSHNLADPDKNRMLLFVHAKLLFLCEKETETADEVSLRGMIWKQPVLYTNASGRRLARLTAAVNRPGSRTDYIPCICWGENARYVSGLEAGSHIKLQGRFQSRDYIKYEESDKPIHHTTCEVYVRFIKGW